MRRLAKILETTEWALTTLGLCFDGAIFLGDIRQWAVGLIMTSVLAVVFVVLGSIWKAIKSQPIPWTLFTLLVLIAIILFVVAIILLQKTHKAPVLGIEREGSVLKSVIVPTIADSPQEVKPPSQDSANRVIVDVTPDYLMGLFDQHTSIQAQRLIEPYIGKWLRVSGSLGDVSDASHGSQLTFERSG